MRSWMYSLPSRLWMPNTPVLPAGSAPPMSASGGWASTRVGWVSTPESVKWQTVCHGVGGATADAVGRRLKALADGSQVLVVTHSPQVAAQGAHHWRVQKQVTGGQTLSTVVPLLGDERTDEIARMLAGDTITEEARAAARALLDG